MATAPSTSIFIGATADGKPQALERAATSSIARQLGTRLMRGILGGLFRGR